MPMRDAMIILRRIAPEHNDSHDDPEIPKNTPFIPAAPACRPLLHSIVGGGGEIRRKESLKCRLGEVGTE